MKNKRMFLNILMIILMPLLMAYSLIGETFHEVAGVLVFILFIIHHIYNRNYFLKIFKSKLNVFKIGQLIINIILLIMMFAQPITGILMSKKLFTFINAKNTSLIRTIHLCLAYWMYILLSIHAGMHIGTFYKKIRKKMKNFSWIFEAIFVIIAVFGIRSFLNRKFIDYLFLRNQFVFLDYSESVIYFIGDYFMIMVLFMFVGYNLNRILRNL